MTSPFPPPTVPRQIVRPTPAAAATSNPWYIAGVLAAVAALVSGFLPWATVRAVFVGEVNITGFEAPDGKLAAIGAGVILLGFLVRVRALAFLASVATLGLAVYEIVQVSHYAEEANAEMDGYGVATVGYGLWVLAAAALLAIIANSCYRQDG